MIGDGCVVDLDGAHVGLDAAEAEAVHAGALEFAVGFVVVPVEEPVGDAGRDAEPLQAAEHLVLGGCGLNGEALAVALDGERERLALPAHGGCDEEVFEDFGGLRVDGADDVARLEAGFVCGRAGHDGADDGRGFVETSREEDGDEEDGGEDDVHHDAGADDDHALPDGFLGVGVWRGGGSGGVDVFLAEHFDIAAEGEPVEAVLGGADACEFGDWGEAFVIARDEFFVFRLGRTGAEAEAFAVGADGLAEADGEGVDADAGPFGGEEVAEFVDGDDEAEAEDHEDDIEDHGVSLGRFVSPQRHREHRGKGRERISVFETQEMEEPSPSPLPEGGEVVPHSGQVGPLVRPVRSYLHLGQRPCVVRMALRMAFTPNKTP
ncbi:MAG: hypothetical protein R3B46_11070 [Phycisphaerales bacterium]